uniref:Alpha/beta hydrolase n=1 Tax=Cyanothece sp. (strain PCC 7425 / ATCC 29141) TaxID=395961 RepID=B8HTH9_CYAP4
MNINYTPPWWLGHGLVQTLYIALWHSSRWEQTLTLPEPPYQEHIFVGAEGVPIYGWMAIPERAHSTIVATYGITGSLENQGILRVLGRKAFAQGFAVVLFDWRAHGQTALLSPTLTSDGLYEGLDFVQIGMQSKHKGCPAPFWFSGYSLGGQLALWGVNAAAEQGWTDLGGAAVLCPNLDSNRSLTYLTSSYLGRQLEAAITRALKQLAWEIDRAHPGVLDPAAIARANSIAGFDRELVIERLGFASVTDYYHASSPLPLLPQLRYPTLILYAADDPLFDPTLVTDLQTACKLNPKVDLHLTAQGGHVGYLSSSRCQLQWGDEDGWWAWNQILQWCRTHSH